MNHTSEPSPTIKKLFIIDSMAMLFRFFYALGGERSPFRNSKGQPTSAVFGMAKLLTRIVTELKPDYLVATADSREPTFRHLLYPAYKANRKVMPPLLAEQLDDFFALYEHFQIQVFKQNGLEADDIIGSLVTKYASPTCHCYIISGDKDFCQLISDQVFLFNPFEKSTEFFGRKEVQAKYALGPEQFIDYLALIGDTSDNIPGCDGIGKVGATKLLQEFGSLQGVYDHLDSISNQRLKNALQGSKDLTFLSRDLATIKTNIDLHLGDLESFTTIAPPTLLTTGLKAQYTRLEFQTLLDKLPELMNEPPKAAAADQKTLSQDPVAVSSSYVLVQTDEALKNLCETLRALKAGDFLAIDTETTGLSPVSDLPIGICLSHEPGKGFYIPLTPEHTQLDVPHIVALLGPIFQGPASKVGHNLKFDLQMLAQIGLGVSGPHYDTMIMDWLLNPGEGRHGLDDCCKRHLDFTKTPTSQIFSFGRGSEARSAVLKASLAELSNYGCEDADYTLRLCHDLLGKIHSLDLTYALEKIEMPMVETLAEMERHGIAIDQTILSELSLHLDQLAEERTREIHALAGSTFNINSPKQLSEVLFERLKIHEQLGIKKIKKTKTGYSTDESVLNTLRAHPLPKLLLEYRTVTKLKNTYVDALPKLLNHDTHCLHTSFNQTGTATGRLSSTEPNLQNIPIRSSLGQDIRRAFVASKPGWHLVSADYSQVELRILAHLAHETALIEAFRKGEDIHATTAGKIFGVATHEVDSSMRSKAKAINFGIIYGMGPMRLAQDTGVSMQQASQFIKKYFASYPGIKTYIDQTVQFAKQHHYVKTITGRRRQLDWDREATTGFRRSNLENIAVNTPIQGSAADLIKIAMAHIHQQIKSHRLKARMLLQVHDELVFESPPDELDSLTALVHHAMTTAMTLEVPLEVNIGHGPNWLKAHE